MMCLAGEIADSKDFSDYIQKNVHLYKYRHGYKLSVKETANWARRQLANALRRSPWQTNVMLAGCDKEGP